MLTLSELASILGISKERIKQIIQKKMEENHSLDIETGTIWKLGPKICRHLLEERGFNFPNKKTISIAALKGGIGKSTLTIHTAVRAATAFGIKTLCIDLDPEACLTNSLAKENEDLEKKKVFYDAIKENISLTDLAIESKYKNLYFIPSSLRNHKTEKEVIGTNPKKLIKEKLSFLDFELIFFELPPSFSTLTGSAYLASNLIILPCTPSIYALESVSLTIEAIDNLADEFEVPEKNYKILMNQYNSKRIASQQVLEALMDSFGSKVLPIQIKQTAEVENAMNAGLTIYETKAPKVIKENFNDLTITICGLES